MIQVEYRNGFAVEDEDEHGYAYYTKKKGKVEIGVSMPMARALDIYIKEIKEQEAK